MNCDTNNDDDQCQHPDGCTKSFFTYCPHCHLYLCILHLNEHHDTLKNDIHQTIHEAENQRVLLEEQMERLKQQHVSLNDFYEREMNVLNHTHQLVKNICENNYLLVSDYDRYVKQWQLIKQDQINNSYRQSFMLQIDQILQQKNSLNESKMSVSIMTDVLPLMKHETTTELYSQSSINEKELIIDSTIDEITTDNDHHQLISDLLSSESKLPMNYVHSTCPLSHINAFGISKNHHVPHIPCDYQINSINFTSDRCFYHLISYHRLKQKVARIILKEISTNKNKHDDFTNIDLFSKCKSIDIVSQGTTLFVGECPLTKRNVYGLQNHPKVGLCTPRPALHLYHHLRSFHRLKSNYARRLIAAMIDNQPTTEELFKPHEQIINNSYRATTR